MTGPSLRDRFDALRRTMRWTWADVDRITGRKKSGTNISKGVPNWARLAIVAHETYQRQLRLHVVDAVRLRLGPGWALVQRVRDDYAFVPDDGAEPIIRVRFVPGGGVVSGNGARFAGLLTDLTELYGPPTASREQNGLFVVTFPLAPPPEGADPLAAYVAQHGVVLPSPTPDLP